MTAVLEVSQLEQRFGNVYALNNISFEMEQGEIIVILGPSGCGKSTLLQQVAGIQQPFQGEIKIDDQLVANKTFFKPPEKREINMVFQDYALWPHMSVYENIVYGLKRKNISKEECKQRVDHLVELLNLQGLLERLPAHLSGGQQQRVGIARALATKPRLLLMDEPLSNLDVKLRLHMRSELSFLLRELHMSVLYVTHDTHEAFALADRIMVLRDGRIEQFDCPKNVFKNPASPWVAQLLGYINQLPGVLEDCAQGQNAYCRVQVGEQQMYGILVAKQKGQKNGSEVEVLFHPEEVRLIDNRLSAYENDSFNLLQGEVEHTIYEGLSWRISIRISEHLLVTALHSTPIAQGSTVWLQTPVSRTFVFWSGNH